MWAFLVLSACFALSLWLRWPELTEPVLGQAGHQLLLAHSAVIAQNWAHEGFFTLHGLAFWTSASAELPTWAARMPYTSFPGGAFALPALATALFKPASAIGIVRTYGVANQFFCALTVASISGTLLKRRGLWPLLPGIALLFTPGWSWHFPNSWFSETATILPFLLLARCDIAGRRGWTTTALTAAMAYCDLSFAAEVTAWRILLGYARPWAIIPVITVGAAHLAAMATLLGATSVTGLFLHAVDHTGTTGGQPEASVFDFIRRIKGYMDAAFGVILWVFAGALALILRRSSHRHRPLLRALALLILPGVGHLLLFRHHAWAHNFNTLRLDAGLMVLLFVALPVVMGWGRRFTALASVALVIMALHWQGLYKSLFTPGPPGPAAIRMTLAAQEIGRTFGPDTVLFSDDLPIPLGPDGLILSVYSRKTTYPLKYWRTAKKAALIFADGHAPPECVERTRLTEGFAYCYSRY